MKRAFSQGRRDHTQQLHLASHHTSLPDAVYFDLIRRAAGFAHPR